MEGDCQLQYYLHGCQVTKLISFQEGGLSILCNMSYTPSLPKHNALKAMIGLLLVSANVCKANHQNISLSILLIHITVANSLVPQGVHESRLSNDTSDDTPHLLASGVNIKIRSDLPAPVQINMWHSRDSNCKDMDVKSFGTIQPGETSTGHLYTWYNNGKARSIWSDSCLKFSSVG